MPISIERVANRAQLKTFIDFPEILYHKCENWVPALRGDEFDTFNPKKNAAFEYCEAECYLAYKDGKLAGRVAAIINHNANNLWNQKCVRFGWLDFIEDEEVLKALMKCVEVFGARRGCDTVKGPLGFTDMDKEGLLVEGYDKLSSFTCLYNYPYYDVLLDRIGYRKDIDWLQKEVVISPELPEMFNCAEIISKRFGLRVFEPKNVKELGRRYGMDIFHMYNETFAPLFEFAPLSDRQIKDYLATYVPILDKDFVAVVINEEERPVAFAFCVPTLSRAVKKGRGRLFPFGFAHILKALKTNDTLEALMIGVLPEYQGSGAALLLFDYLHRSCIRRGIKRMILNPQLETNIKVLSIFDAYETSQYTRRRAYFKTIANE